MRRKSTRNAQKISPEKSVKETETPPKTRRSKRRRRSPSKSSDSEEEIVPETKCPEPEATPDTTTKSHTPTDEEASKEPVWKVTSSEDASLGDVHKLKLCLTRPSPESPDKNRPRRSKSNSQTEDDATSSEDKSSTRRTRSRGSPFVRNDGLSSQEGDEDAEEKKGKGKSKGKHKSKIEKSPQLSEPEQTNSEISENVQVTPQSPSIDKPVDNESDHNKVDVDDLQNVNESIQKQGNIDEDSASNIDKNDSNDSETVKNDDTRKSVKQNVDSDDDEPLSVIQKIVSGGTEIADEVVVFEQQCEEIEVTSTEVPQESTEAAKADDVSPGIVEPDQTETEQEETVTADKEDIQTEAISEHHAIVQIQTIIEVEENSSEKSTPQEEITESDTVLNVSENNTVEQSIEENIIIEQSIEEINTVEQSIETNSTIKQNVEENNSIEQRIEENNSVNDSQVDHPKVSTEDVNEAQVNSPPKSPMEVFPELKNGTEKHDNNERSSVRRLRRAYEAFTPARTKDDDTEESSGIKPYHNRRKWEGGTNLTSSLVKIDLETLQSVWPSIDFPEEPDLKLNLERERRKSTAEPPKKVERKVSVEYKSDTSEKPPYEKQTSVSSVTQDSEDNSNIIAFNRKISIVDDTASKLRPPPSPAKNPVSDVLFITNLVRPFTLKQLKELLERTGKIQQEGFWTDRIKSKCYVQYETEEEAEATRNALHGVQWPIGNGKKLIIDYGTVDDLKNAKNPPAPPPVAPAADVKVSVKENLEPVEIKARSEEKGPKEIEKKRSEGPIREWDIGKKDVRRERSRSRERNRKHRRSPTPPDDFIIRKQRKAEESVPQKLMDDLFLKTKATPSIYWQPLSPEEISMKQQQRLIRMEEHKRRMEETSRMKGREMGRGGFRRRYD